jgi:H+/Cl- antiporter ClcA
MVADRTHRSRTVGVDLSDLAGALALAVVVSIPLAVTVWALLDAARRPQWAWALAGRRQVVWMAAIMLTSLTLLLGLVVSGWYLRRVRPLIRDAEDGRLV